MNEDPEPEPQWDEGDLHIIADMETWLDTAVVGENLPSGATNGDILMNDAGWQACEDDADRVAFLALYAPLASIWNRILGRVRRALLEAKMISMVLDWIADKVQGHGG